MKACSSDAAMGKGGTLLKKVCCSARLAKQRTGVLSPTPRGSKLTKSKRASSSGGDKRQGLAHEIEPGAARSSRVEHERADPVGRISGRMPDHSQRDAFAVGMVVVEGHPCRGALQVAAAVCPAQHGHRWRPSRLRHLRGSWSEPDCRQNECECRDRERTSPEGTSPLRMVSHGSLPPCREDGGRVVLAAASEPRRSGLGRDGRSAPLTTLSPRCPCSTRAHRCRSGGQTGAG